VASKTPSQAPSVNLSGKDFLKRVVQPVLESSLSSLNGCTPEVQFAPDESGNPSIASAWTNTQLLRVAFERRDEKRATLHFDLFAGIVLGDVVELASSLAFFLDHTPFRFRSGPGLLFEGQMFLSSELPIHSSDNDLVRERTAALVKLAYDIEWFSSIYFPSRLGLNQAGILIERYGDDLMDRKKLDQLLADSIKDPALKDDPMTVPLLAKGLGNWKEVINAVNRASLKMPEISLVSAPLLSRAWQELGRWHQVIETSLNGGLQEGRFPEALWLNPSYLRALIETGEDIEALRLLGGPKDSDPGFYDLMRGQALISASDTKGAYAAYERYLNQWPGDIEARHMAAPHFSQGE